MPALAELQLVIDSKPLLTANSQLTIFVKSADDATKASDNLNKQTKETGNQFNGLLGLVAKLTAAYLSYAAVKKLVVGGLEEEANYERLVKGFTTLTGSVGQATTVLDELRQYSLDTGFSFDNIAEGAKKMVALGFSAGQAVEAIKGMGDEVRALGGTEAQLNGLIQRIGIIKEIGVLNTRIFRQFASEGIDAYKIIGDETGRTVDEVKRLAKAGALDVDNTLAALVAGMANHAKNAAGAAQVTIGELWNRILQRGSYALEQIGKSLTETFDLRGVLKKAIDYIDYFTALIIDVGRKIAGLPVLFKGNEDIATGITKFLNDLAPLFERIAYLAKFWFQVIWETAKEGLMAFIDEARKELGLLLSGVGAALSKFASPTGLGLLKAIGGTAAQAALSDVNPEDLKKISADLAETGKNLAQPLFPEQKISDYTDALKGYGKELSDNLKTVKSTDTFYDLLTKGIVGEKDIAWKDRKDAFIAEKAAIDARKGVDVTALRPPGDIRLPYSDKEAQQLHALADQFDELGTKVRALDIPEDERANVLAYEKEKNKLIKDGFDIEGKSDEASAPRNAKAREFLEIFRQTNEQLKRMQELRKVADDIGHAFGSAFEEFVTGAKSAKQAFQDLAKEIEKIILNAVVTKPLETALSGGIFGILKGLGLGGPAPATPSYVPTVGTESAKGNIFGPGGLIPFAYGGVVNGPTLFPFARGTGLMGERGPEAIMPLTRGSDGKLGVKASGSKTTNVTMNVYTNDADSFRRSSRQIASGLRKVTGN